MAQIEGKYINYKNENLDEYFKGLGVPYIPRKLMCNTHPTLEISKVDENTFIISVSSLLRTSASKFRLGEDYEEEMPGGTLKSVSTLEGNKLTTQSVGPGEVKSTREYEFRDDGFTITYTTDKTPAVGKRHYKRN